MGPLAGIWFWSPLLVSAEGPGGWGEVGGLWGCQAWVCHHWLTVGAPGDRSRERAGQGASSRGWAPDGVGRGDVAFCARTGSILPPPPSQLHPSVTLAAGGVMLPPCSESLLQLRPTPWKLSGTPNDHSPLA